MNTTGKILEESYVKSYRRPSTAARFFLGLTIIVIPFVLFGLFLFVVFLFNKGH